MDYNQAALKLLCMDLKQAVQTPSQSSFTIYGILFQRAWLQGVIVHISDDRSRFVLDDGTGTIQLTVSRDILALNQWTTGMYVMVVGIYFVSDGEDPAIRIHKMVDLSEYPDREAMWYLEVIEAFKLFYQPEE